MLIEILIVISVVGILTSLLMFGFFLDKHLGWPAILSGGAFIVFTVIAAAIVQSKNTTDLTLTPIAIYCPEVEVCHSTILINDKDTITIQLPSNNIKLNKTIKVNFSK